MKTNSKQKSNKKDTARRVIVWILAILMVGAPVAAAIGSVYVNAAYEMPADDTIVRIGLLYGSNTVSAFNTRSPYGFEIATVDKETNETEIIYSLGAKSIEVAIEANLEKSGGDYVVGKSADIGAYHAMLNTPLRLDEMYLAMNVAVNNGLKTPLIASYSDGAYRLFAGSFESADDAQAFIDANPNAFAGMTVDNEPAQELVVYEPSESAVVIIDPSNDMTVFEYDGHSTSELGVMAKDSKDGEHAYLQTPANKLYDGVFIFTRADGGIMLVNMIGMEDYVMGVLPYEISNTWPLETQKAFAVSVRSYAVNKLNRHMDSYGFNLCNTGCCQTYNGVRNVNDTVRQAVEETRYILLYDKDGNVLTTFYSAVAGGTTVSAYNAWGGSDQKYLTAKPTPWEDYSKHPNGMWQVSISGKELADHLISGGYTEINSAIVDIECEYPENSEYVSKITFTDKNGNKLTIKNSDTIRTKLSAFVKSANFKVGKGSLEINDPAFGGDGAKTLFSRIDGKDKITYVNWTEPMKVLGANGDKYTWANVDIPVINGEQEIVYPDRTIEIESDSSDEFIIVGRGWGHGVGLSQVGAHDLGRQGFCYEFILAAYFPETYTSPYMKIADDIFENELFDEGIAEEEDVEEESFDDEE